jgi:hypothetical protein
MSFPLALPPLDPAFEILISSQGMSQGLQQTQGLQLFPRASVAIGRAQFGAQWRNVDSSTANGVAALFAKYGKPIGKTQIEATVRYRIRTGHSGTAAPTAWEFAAAATHNFGKASVRAIAEYSPDEFGRGPSLFVEAGPSFTMGRTRLTAAVGHRMRRADPDYSTFNIGMSRTVATKLILDARLHATDRPGWARVSGRGWWSRRGSPCENH